MGVRIQELPETTGINKEDVLIVEDGQGTKKGTVQQLDEALGVSQLKEDLGDIKKRIDATTETVTGSGTEFNGLNPSSNVYFEAIEDAVVSSFSKNQFVSPNKLQVKNHTSTVHDIILGEETITASLDAGNKYAQITMNPIFVKSGQYTFSASIEILNGVASGNIGFIYIHKTDKDGNVLVNNWSSIQLNADRLKSFTVKTVEDDTFLSFSFYVNMNGTVTENITLKWYDISINKEDSYSNYEKYIGSVVKGTSGYITKFENMNIVSDHYVTISYKFEIADDSFESVKKQVEINRRDIEELKSDINVNNKTIICWGDSLTCGTGSTTLKPSTDTNNDVSYPAVLSRMLSDGYNVLNGGVGGETSWLVAYRQGGETIYVEPMTIPSTKTETRVYLRGQEEDYYLDSTNGKWTYSKGNLTHNISVDEKSRVNPCYIGGIKGTLSRTLLSSGTADPTTGETVQTDTFAYYFTRDKEGIEVTFNTPKHLVTNAYKTLRGATSIFWVGQNDAHLHDGKYVTQGNARDRVNNMIDVLSHKNYIVIDLPNGNNISSANRVQGFSNDFGNHYLNIREYICKYGIDYANSLGANITPSSDDEEMLSKGEIPSCLRIDGVHGNYWYYQIVAKAVYDKGVDLGYWN